MKCEMGMVIHTTYPVQRILVFRPEDVEVGSLWVASDEHVYLCVEKDDDGLSMVNTTISDNPSSMYPVVFRISNGNWSCNGTRLLSSYELFMKNALSNKYGDYYTIDGESCRVRSCDVGSVYFGTDYGQFITDRYGKIGDTQYVFHKKSVLQTMMDRGFISKDKQQFCMNSDISIVVAGIPIEKRNLYEIVISNRYTHRETCYKLECIEPAISTSYGITVVGYNKDGKISFVKTEYQGRVHDVFVRPIRIEQKKTETAKEPEAKRQDKQPKKRR